MAAITHAVTTANLSDLETYPSGAFTPAAGDLLVVFVGVRASVVATSLVSSVGGKTFSLVASARWNGSVERVHCYVADQLADAVSQTVTFNCVGDAAQGCIISGERISGMTRTALSAVRQFKISENNAGATTPDLAFDAAALTGNPTLGAVSNATNPAGLTEPTGWIELADTGHNSPAHGLEVVGRDSGFTGTTVVWGSASATVHGDIIIELDASEGAASFPQRSRMSWGFGIGM